MFGRLTRYMAVFCLAIAAAALVSFSSPMDWNPRNVFLYFIIAFFAYIGVDLYRLKGRNRE